MTFIPTSQHSVLPSGNATTCQDAKGLLILEGGCPLFAPDQIVTWINQYCEGIKPFKSGVTIAVMYAAATVQQLLSMDRVVRDNLAVHFGSIVILGAYSPLAGEYHEDVIALNTHNRNRLYLLSNEFFDGMLHDTRFQISNDECRNKAWEEALGLIFGISVPDYDRIRPHYTLSCGTAMFTCRQSPQPSVRTKAELQEGWQEADRIINSMPTRDPRADVPDHKQTMTVAGELWQR